MLIDRYDEHFRSLIDLVMVMMGGDD